MLGLASFLAGLGLARLRWQISAAWMILSFVFVAAFARRKNLVLALAVVAFGMLAGLWRGGQYMELVGNYDNLYGQKITLVGTATDDAIYANGGQLSFDADHLEVTSPVQTELVGKIGIKGFGVPAVYRGDKVEVSGRLYKTRGSRSGSISFAQITVQKRSSSFINDIKRRFQAGMQSALPEPLASFSLGLLIGQRNTLPESLTAVMATVGLTHIVAVSGYNLTIIVRAVRRFLNKLSKYQSTIISFILILTFLLFTGFSPSIVRAAIVSVLSIAAWYYGRAFRPLLILLLTAALTAGFYPIYIWSDIGWYLSFLAFFGVLIIAPLLAKRLFKNKRPHALAYLAIESFAAQLMAWPLIMYIFGEFSLIALPANMLIVPLVPFAMLLSAVAGAAGMLAPALAGWFAWPAKLLLTYMVDIMQLMAKVPHALSKQGISLVQMILIYFVVVVLCGILWRKTRGRSGTITENDGIKP